MERIESFKSFSQVRAQLKEQTAQKEISAKREVAGAKYGDLLKKYEVASVEELAEDKRRAFVTDLFGLQNEEQVAESFEINEAKSDRANVIAAWTETGVKDLNAIAKIYAEAMEDANFHRETGTSKAIGSASRGGKVGGMGQDIAGAAKWNGIAIANGTVDFLKEIGEDKAADKLLAAITKFDLNESVELGSLEQIIEEGTRGFFGKIDKKGNISAVYTHYDSYPEYMLPTIKKGYKNVKDVEAVIAKGDSSGLEADIDKMKFYNDKDSMKPLTGNVKDTDKFLRNAAGEGGAEFVYLYDERDGMWYMSDIYKTRELVPAFESVVAEAADDFAGWIAFFNGKRVEIKKDEAKDLWAAKKLAIQRLKVSKSKEYMVAIAPAVEEMFVAEADVDIHDEVSGTITDLYAKLNDLAEETTDSAWRKAIENIIKGVEAVEKNIDKAAHKLGIVPVHEEEVAIEEAEINNEEEFRAYAEEVLKKAHGEDYDEAKAKAAIDGILAKADGDFGAAIGMLTSGLGEAVEVSEREYSDDEREELAKKGFALPDGSFPIADIEDLKNAIHAYGRAADQAAAAKHIAKRAKALGAEDLIPDSEDFQKSLKEAVNLAEDMVPGGLADGMSAQDLADRHGVDVAEIEAAIEKGIKVEMEHTDDKKIAHEVAMDHIFEDPKYYDKLADMENESAEVSEGAKEEQIAMELYVELVEPRTGEYSPKDLEKMDLEELEDLVASKGYKGREAEKIAKELHDVARG